MAAYACDPSRGSEPAVGWQSVRAALEVADETWVVTRRKNVGRLAQALDPVDRKRTHVVGLDGGRWSLLAKKHLPAGTQLYYLYWQRLLGRKVRSLSSEHTFDAAHHATFAADWVPSGLRRVPGVPFVWGPVGGSASTPPHLWRYLGFRGFISDISHRAVTKMGRTVLSAGTASAAAVTLAQNDDTARRLRLPAASVRPNVAVALDGSAADGIEVRGAADVVGAGRLIPWKGWALLIAALERTTSNVQVTVYGEGPDRRRLERLARRRGVAHRLHLPGSVPRDFLLQRVMNADAFLSLSFQEAAGWSVAEATALGVPVIGLDLGGVGVLLRGCGIRPLPALPPRTLVRRVASALDAAAAGSMTAPARQAWSADAFRSAIGRALRLAARTTDLAPPRMEAST